jgi:hypothetical protein
VAEASAAVTQSNVTVLSPSGKYLIADQVTPADTIALNGTSNGNASDTVDLNCYYGSTFRRLVSGISLGSDGSFSYSGPLTISQRTCVLRAVPAGDPTAHPPGTATTFTGPTLAVSQRTNTVDTTSPNQGKLEQYYIYGAQLRGAFDYFSLGNCEIDDSFVYDAVTFRQSQPLDYCNAYFWPQNGLASTAGFASPTRSELKVDGASGYLAGAIGDFTSLFGLSGAEGFTGFPALTYNYSLSPVTGNLVIVETDQVVKCAPTPNTYPPDASSCTHFAPTGIQVKVKTTQGQGGRVATVLQSFSSTDGHSHPVDLLDDNQFFTPNKDGEFDFPWTSTGMAQYKTVGQSIAAPSKSGPGSFFIKGSAKVPDGGEATAQGAATFSNAPSGETIIGTTNNTSEYSWVDLHYARTVPAKGSVNLAFTYSNAFRNSEVQADAKAAQAAFAPTLAISSPHSGKKIGSGSVTVSGLAHDFYGLASVKVNGKSVHVNANGSWKTKVKLHKGSNKITAAATNIFGNTTSRQVTVSFSPLTLSSVKQTHRRWRETASAAGKAPVGTKFSFALSHAARVTFNFTRQAKKGPGGPSGKLSFAGKPGHNSRSFTGKLGTGKLLKPGRYSVAISASATGASTKATTLTFTIIA